MDHVTSVLDNEKKVRPRLVRVMVLHGFHTNRRPGTRKVSHEDYNKSLIQNGMSSVHTEIKIEIKMGLKEAFVAK